MHFSPSPELFDFISRFEQECQILRDLKHPNIVQFLGVVQDPTTNKPIILMELIKHCFSLTSFLPTSEYDIPYHVQVNISHDIALAVAHLHRNSILHRDLSSNNILLSASHQAKVTDFQDCRSGTLHVPVEETRLHASSGPLSPPTLLRKSRHFFSRGAPPPDYYPKPESCLLC